MTKSACAGLAAAILLTACGGGGSSGSTSTTAPSTSTPVVAKRVTAGDVYTFSRRDTTTGGAVSNYDFSREYQVVNDDGSSVDVETYSNAYAPMETAVSPAGGVTSSGLKYNATSKCTYSPANIGATAPYQVGRSWDNAWTSTCGTVVSRGTNKGSIVGTESVTVPAGTFNTYKEVYVVTTQQTSPASDQVVTNNITCWRDVDMKQYVKCEYAVSYSIPSAAGNEAIASAAYELQGYIVSGAARTVATPARFAGTWSGSFYGYDLGTCASLTVSTTGQITGSCEGRVIPAFTVTGSVDAQGNVTFNSNAPSVPSFTGQFRLINEVTGSWTANPNMSGFWAMYHK